MINKKILIPLSIFFLLFSMVVFGTPNFVDIGPTTEFGGDAGVPEGSAWYIGEERLGLKILVEWTFTHMEDPLLFGEFAKIEYVRYSNFEATSAPTVNDDTDLGYIVGSLWYDVTADKGYACLDNTNGAAVWVETTSLGTTTFTGLTDTPANYTGEAGKYIKVNSGEDALEFGAAAGEANTASNIGTGAEVFKQKTGVDLELRKIEAGSNQINVSWYTEGDLVKKENFETYNTTDQLWEDHGQAQSFTTTSAHNVKAVGLYLQERGTPTHDITVSIYASSGDLPTGDALVSGTIAKENVESGLSWVDCIFSGHVELSDATKYVLVIMSDCPVYGSSYFIGGQWDSDLYAGGICSVWNGSSWAESNYLKDILFRVYSLELSYQDQIMVDVNEENIRAGLLSITTVDFNADADTTLYIVPTEKRLVLSHAVVVAAGDAGGTTTVSIGANGAETDFVPANTLSNLDAEYDSVVLKPIPNTTPLKIKSYVAATVIEAQVANQSGVAGNTIYLFGNLY